MFYKHVIQDVCSFLFIHFNFMCEEATNEKCFRNEIAAAASDDVNKIAGDLKHCKVKE